MSGQFLKINSVGKSTGNHKQECKSTSKEPQLFITTKCMQVMHERRCSLPICAGIIGDLELIGTKKLRFLLYLMWPGKNEFICHGLTLDTSVQ